MVYPTGGLADTLQIVGAGLQLARECDRNLVISGKAGQLHAKHFDSLFAFPSPMGDCLEREVSKIHGVELAPPSDGNQIGISADGSGKTLCEASSIIREQMGEQTIHVWGGVGLGETLSVFEAFRFNPEILEKWNALKDVIGEPYSAIHVRNTDYRTEYKSLLRKIAKKDMRERLFIATDSPVVRTYARELLGDRAVVPDRVGYENEAPIHKSTTVSAGDDARAMCQDAMVDLLALAFADQLYIAPTFGLKGSYEFRYSGFSLVAESLNRDPSFPRFVKDSADTWRRKARTATRVVTSRMMLQFIWRQRLRLSRLVDRKR